MPDDTITLVSTTDTAEEVQAALTERPTPAPPTEKTEKPAAPPAEGAETPEQQEDRETREASEAGGKLAKRKDQIQREIDKLWAIKNNARRDVEAEEARLSELRQQREQIESTGKAAAPPASTPPADTPAADEAPEPKLDSVDEKGNAKYATYEDWLSDHSKWTREQAVAATRKVIDEEKQADRERIERESTSRVVNERLATYNASLETFKQTHADFDAAFSDAKEALQDTLMAIGPNALRVVDGYTVFDAEDGPALSYYLLKRPDELKALVLKPAQQQLIHLARLEERIRGGAPKKNGPSIAASPESKAPEPIRPVGSGPTATSVPLDEESFQDYRARRERELRAKRGL